MPVRTIASFAVAILLGVIAVWMVNGYIKSHAGQVAGPVSSAGSQPVVVASTSIDRGATVQASMLKVVNYPAGNVPAGAFSNLSQLSGSGPTARMALRAMVPNEPVLASRISEPGGKANLSSTLVAGMRAISVRSSDVAGVGGFLLPGDRIDVLVTRQIGTGEGASSVTQVLAENVRVLGIDQTDDQDATKPMVTKAVTLEVSPDQAQSISLAQSVGGVTLSLRQFGDVAPLTRFSTTVAELGHFGGAKPAAAPAHKAAKPAAPQAPVIIPVDTRLVVHVVRGVESSNYSVNN